MNTQTLLDALNSFSDTINSPWDPVSLKRLAAVDWDHSGKRDWITEADFKVIFLRWLAESVQPIVDSKVAPHELKAKLVEQVFRYIEESDLFNGESGSACDLKDLRFALVRVASKIAVESRTKRPQLSDIDRRELLKESGSPPRCYLCGSEFSDKSIARFRRLETAPLLGFILVDMFFPRGTKPLDLQIEVDHVRPVAKGGGNDGNNLRLSCGYCNRVKSDSLTIFDKTRYGPTINYRTKGIIRLPHPSWVLRLLALNGACSVCDSASNSSPLFIAPIVWSHYLNPLNLRVYCSRHDPIQDLRYINARELDKRPT